MAPIFVMFATNINETTHTLHDEPGINLVCDNLFLWRSCFNRNIQPYIYVVSTHTEQIISVADTMPCLDTRPAEIPNTRVVDVRLYLKVVNLCE